MSTIPAMGNPTDRHRPSGLRRESFDPGAMPAETAAMYEQIHKIAGAMAIPDTAEEMRASERQSRAQLSPDKAIYESPDARTEVIDGPGGDLALRIVGGGSPAGAYLHVHGGGFVIGGAAYQDKLLERFAADTGLAVVSVEYRLAPEHPFPAARDDVEAAARWLVEHAEERFGTSALAIGGDSAGANLALGAALRLRADDRPHPFRALNLLYGWFDLSGTPSQDDPAIESILTIGLARWFLDQYVPDASRRRDPEVSPLYADLAGLPPTIVSVGSEDRLLDDSTFLYARLLAAGVPCELQVLAGCDHSFEALPLPAVAQAGAVIADYVASALATTPAARASSGPGR